MPLAARVCSVGIGVGLWMALLTHLPFCPGKGFGHSRSAQRSPGSRQRSASCAAQPQHCWCLLASVAVSLHVSRVAIVDVGSSSGRRRGRLGRCGWRSHLHSAELRVNCARTSVQRFAAWESALIGLAAAVLIVVIRCPSWNPEFRIVNMRAVRTVERWLFQDLSSRPRLSATSV